MMPKGIFLVISSILFRCYQLLNVTAAAAAAAASDETDVALSLPWSCDALTPNLCPLTVEEGRIQMKGGLWVTYWKYDRIVEDKSSASEGISDPPVIVLHGGPSFPHNYLLPLKQLACRGGDRPRSVIFYDQAGCGASAVPAGTSIEEDFPWLLDPRYYALEELPQFIAALGIGTYHLLGHSWGTLLAQMFALDAPSQTDTVVVSTGAANQENDSTTTTTTVADIRARLLSMTLSAPISDTKLYIAAQWDTNNGSLGSLPPFIQERIRVLEAAKAYDTEEYQALNNVLEVKFDTRTAPIPACVVDATAGVNVEIYVAMQGASEFTMHGILAEFNVTGRLAAELSTMPVLLTSGRYDTVRPRVVEIMRQNLPLAERVLFEKSGHVSALDEPDRMNRLVDDFLRRVEDQGANFQPVPYDNRKDGVVENDVTRNEFVVGTPLEGNGFMDTTTTQGSWLRLVIVFVAGAVVGHLVTRQYYPHDHYNPIP